MIDGIQYAVTIILAALLGAGLVAAYIWKRGLDAPPARNYKDIILNYTYGSYYYYNLATGEEIFAPKLLHILGLEDFNATFEQFKAVFDDESYQRLCLSRQELKQEKSHLRIELTARDKKKIFECYANAEHNATQPAQAMVFWFRDITSMQHKVEALTEQNKKMLLDIDHGNLVLNTLSMPVWRRNSALHIEYCNAAYGMMVDSSPDKIIDAEEYELHKQSRAFAHEAAQEKKAKSERRHLIVKGTRKWYEITEIPVKEGQGTIGFGRDISDLEEMQAEIERHISAQSDLLESSRNAMAIYGVDMRLKSYNYAFATLWGMEESWLDTEPAYSQILETLREKRKLPEHANFPMFKQNQIKLFHNLTAPQEEFYYLPDGKSLRVIAIPHAMGGILFSYEDVTDRLALERSYNTLIAVQRETLDKLHEGVAVFGEDGRLKLSNPMYRKLWNLSETLEEQHFQDILDQTKPFFKAGDAGRFHEQLMAHSQVRVFNYQRLERTDGSVIDWTSVPLPDGATLFTFFDVTDSTLVERSLREKNEALQAADKLKTEFLANVSYELRSPLTSISGFAEMLGHDYFGPLTTKQREYVEGIHQASLQLMHLINDILDLATIEAGYMQLSISRFDIYGLLSSVLSLVNQRAKEMGIRLKLSCAHDLGEILADETRVKQVLFNLLSNAIKYTPEGGEVQLGAEHSDENEVSIWVKDNGVGIAPEEQQAVFSKFYKGNIPGIQKTGTGLGLPMVKSFIELHGGRVELYSSLGMGTKITCRLPRNSASLEQYIIESIAI